MTNREKFKEIFGYTPTRNHCLVPEKFCKTQMDHDRCPFNGWWDKEYKPCFSMKEEYDDGK